MPAARRSVKALSRRLGNREQQARSSAVEVRGRLGWFDQTRPGGSAARASRGAELAGRSRRLPGLRRAETAGKAREPVEQEKLPHIALTLPARPGEEPQRLEVELVRHHQHETAGLMDRYALRGGLLLSAEAEGSLEHWHKNVQLVTDLVFLDSEGAIREILAGVPPSPPRTLWPEVPIYEGYGAHVLVLEAGQARAFGLQPGQRIGGLETAEPLLEAVRYREDEGEPVSWLLEGGEEGFERFVEYLKAFPSHGHLLDTALRGLKAKIRQAGREEGPKLEQYRRTQKKLIERILVGKGFENQGGLEALVSLSNPWQWFRHLPFMDKLFLPWALIFEFPVVFAHEFGHYLAARAFGVPIEQFRVGLNGSGHVRPAEDVAGWRDAVISVAGPLATGVLGAVALTLGGLLIWTALSAALPFPGLDSVNWGMVVLGAYFSNLGLWGMMEFLPSGSQDWPDAAAAMGWRRLAKEMEWRRDRERQGVLGTWRAVAAQGAAYLLRRLARKIFPSARVPLGPERLGLTTRLQGPFRTMTAGAIDLAGRQLATVGQDGALHVWDALSGRQLDVLPDDVDGGGNIYVLQFSPDGRRLAAAKEDGRVHLWDLSEHGAGAPGDPISPEDGGKRSGPAAARIFGELPPGKKFNPTLRALEFSPDGAWLASGDEEGTVTVWRVEDGAVLRTFSLDGVVNGAAFSADGGLLAVTERGGTVRVWDTATWSPRRSLSYPVAELADPEDEENAVAFSPDGKRLAVGAADGHALLVWDLESARAELFPAAEAPGSWTVGVTFSPDGEFVAAGDMNGNLHIWPLNGARPPFHQRLEDVVFGVRFDSSGQALIVVDREGNVSRFY